MISIVVCSRMPDIPSDLKKNIKESIGTDYELIVIDNSLNKYSIFSAYNEGLKIANGDILCYMHEDVYFHTSKWGSEVEKYFQLYPNAGMVGVAGTHYLASMPSAWWDSEICSGQLLQGATVNGEYRVVREDSWLDYKKNPTLVVSVDGLWMCFQRKVFDMIKWDDSSFVGFHCYDTDISLQVWNAGYEVHIFWDMLLEHKSLGSAGADFYDSLNILYRKWKHILPLVEGVELSKSEMQARSRIVELRHELYRLNSELSTICKSRQYRWGQYLFNPTLAIKRVLLKITNSFRNKNRCS